MVIFANKHFNGLSLLMKRKIDVNSRSVHIHPEETLLLRLSRANFSRARREGEEGIEIRIFRARFLVEKSKI